MEELLAEKNNTIEPIREGEELITAKEQKNFLYTT